MKAIVANLILGSVACIISSGIPAWADSSASNRDRQKIPAILSAKALIYQGDFVLPPAFILESQNFNYSIYLEDKDYIKKVIQQDSWQLDRAISHSAIDLANERVTSLKKSPYLEENAQEDLIIGKHHTFWHHENKPQYWGLTTVKTWGDGKIEDLSVEQLNYIDAAPVLAPGTAALTISGGSQQNKIEQNTLLGDVADFQGGVAFHQSVAEEVTVGLGFVYEEFLLGFSQLTYKPENFPLRTTVSLFQGKEGIEVHSHLKLQPSEAIVFNLYSDNQDQKFDLNWGLVSGLTLTADGNSATESLRAGAKLVYKGELVFFTAKAQLDNNNELQWQIRSQLGDFKLKYVTDAVKTKTEVKYDFDTLSNSGFQCSFFFNNQTRQRRKKEDSLAVWGWNIHSTDKVGEDRYRWEINLGYGFGSAGKGAIASLGTAINSSLALKLSYEAVALASEENRVKLELSSH